MHTRSYIKKKLSDKSQLARIKSCTQASQEREGYSRSGQVVCLIQRLQIMHSRTHFCIAAAISFEVDLSRTLPSLADAVNLLQETHVVKHRSGGLRSSVVPVAICESPVSLSRNRRLQLAPIKLVRAVVSERCWCAAAHAATSSCNP